MRAFQIFASLPPEDSVRFFALIREKSPGMYTQTVHAASAAMKSRPTYLMKQKPDKRALALRRALSRVNTNVIAEELLAVYFLECRLELLTEWLDVAGVKHDEGKLEEDEPAQPDEPKLTEALGSFRGAGDDWDRELLLKAFAAQSAIEWPLLEAALAPQQS
jgi:hypothetical protein